MIWNFFHFKVLISVLDYGYCPFCMNLWVGFAAQYPAAWVLILQGHGYMFGFWVFVKVKTESSYLKFEVIGTAWAMWLQDL